MSCAYKFRLRYNFHMKNGTCPKCQSKQIVTDVRIIDRGHGDSTKNFSVALYKNRDALLFKGQRLNSLAAYICRTCGFTELYVTNLERFNEDYHATSGEEMEEINDEVIYNDLWETDIETEHTNS